MDFQHVADSIGAMTCIVSVEKLPDGGYGKIRIVTGNRTYLDSIERPADKLRLLTTRFEPNSEYTRYLSRDLNFEDFCYRAAVEKKCLHSYAHPDRMDAWFNMTFLPLWPDDGNICYCTYTMEVNDEPSPERLSNVSGELAAAILETSIRLRGARDFRAAMGEVIKDIRVLCHAEHCCILLMDSYSRTCSVLCQDFAEDTKLRPMETYLDDGYYEIAASWEDTVIAGSNCLIAKNERDMEVVKERNPRWYRSLTDGFVRTIVLFPLRSQGELLGYMWASNFSAGDAGRIKETLELATFILGSEIGNDLLVNRLKELSSRDLLTGTRNRNMMNNYVDRLSSGEEGRGRSVGVVFADLNGLKTVNDTRGHDAGDRLLRDAAAALGEVFRPEEIFRAGGDEFAMILTAVTPEEVAEKIAAIRAAAAKYDDLVFAVGGCVEADGTCIYSALRQADAAMYEDKKRYYEAHPEKKRERGGGRLPEKTP